MNKYCKFQGKIITLSSFLSAPKKGYNLRTLGPQRTFAKKWWSLKVLSHFAKTEGSQMWGQPMTKKPTKNPVSSTFVSSTHLSFI
jgi:hypothetical protein